MGISGKFTALMKNNESNSGGINMICKNCGAQLPDNSIFCGNCGTAQDKPQPQQTAGFGGNMPNPAPPVGDNGFQSAPPAFNPNPNPNGGFNPPGGVPAAPSQSGHGVPDLPQSVGRGVPDAPREGRAPARPPSPAANCFNVFRA